MSSRIGSYLRRHHLALVAILLALTGTAYAAGKINGKHIKRNSIPANRLKDSARKSLQGQQGPQGVQGVQGAPGTARAYAYVKASATNPTFKTEQTKGFTAVSLAGGTVTGVYCLTPDSTIDPSKTPIAVTPVWNGGIINNAFAQLREGSLCASGQLQVFTYYDSGEYPTGADGIDFTVVVP